MMAIHHVLRESSRVLKRRRPHMWVAEFTAQVACSPNTTRRQNPHKNIWMPPKTRSPTPKIVVGTQ